MIPRQDDDEEPSRDRDRDRDRDGNDRPNRRRPGIVRRTAGRALRAAARAADRRRARRLGR